MKIAVIHGRFGSERSGHQSASVEGICGAIEAMGHTTAAIDVSEAPSRALVALEETDADLVFNVARTRGRQSELLYPALLEQLDLPFVGSDSQTCATVRDKRLARTLVARHGVQSPRSVLVRRARDLSVGNLRFPVLLTPNFEGHEEDLADHVVVATPAELRQRLSWMLEAYPEGVLIEDVIAGRDVTVFLLEKCLPHLPAAVGYQRLGERDARGAAAPYDYWIRRHHPDRVAVQIPAKLTAAELDAVERAAASVFDVLSIRDVGEVQFRVTPVGDVHFLHASTLPRLDPDAPIYLASRRNALDADGVVAMIVRSAIARHALEDPGAAAHYVPPARGHAPRQAGRP